MMVGCTQSNGENQVEGSANYINIYLFKHVGPSSRIFTTNFPSTTLAMRPPPLASLLLLPLTLSQALKFELFAQPQAHLTPRCIRNYVGADTLVVVTATVSGSKGDGQWVNIEVSLPPNPRGWILTKVDSGY